MTAASSVSEIPLHNGMRALVDTEDFDELNRYNWTARPTRLKGRVVWYADRKLRGQSRTISMHIQVMGTFSTGKHVDHRNGNGLDNRRSNLRVTTRSRNGANRAKQPGTSSRYKGVSWHEYQGKWRAELRSLGKRLLCSYHGSEEEAALAYNAAALRAFGEFAKVNKITK